MIYQPSDLVLLWRFAVDKDKGRKLEAKWEGPYRITRITKSEISVWLEDLCTGAKKGRYSIDDLKIYVAREHGVKPEGHIRLDGGRRKDEITGCYCWRSGEGRKSEFGFTLFWFSHYYCVSLLSFSGPDFTVSQISLFFL